MAIRINKYKDLVGYDANKKVVIRVDGWDMEYTVTDRKLTIENFRNVELGSSSADIISTLGEPDGWVGGGILRPVYILEDGNAVICSFTYPLEEEDLREIEVYMKNGESRVIKQKQHI